MRPGNETCMGLLSSGSSLQAWEGVTAISLRTVTEIWLRTSLEPTQVACLQDKGLGQWEQKKGNQLLGKGPVPSVPSVSQL